MIDFDAETGDDPQQHGEYAMQTFQYYKVTQISQHDVAVFK